MHMSRYSHIVPSLLVALAAVASASEEPLRINTTGWREQEQAGDIRTVYYDLRTSPPYGAEPGMTSEWPHATLRLGISQEHYVWDSDSLLAAPPGAPIAAQRKPLEEDRTAYTAVYRQSLWTPSVWDAQIEIRAGYTQRNDPSGEAAGMRDTDALLLIPLAVDRYTSLVLGAGVSLPTGDEGDWFTSHGKVGYIASLRATGLVADWTTAALSVEGRMVPNAEQTVYTAPVPTVAATCDYSGLAIAGSLGYRISSRFAAGISQRWEGHWYNTVTVPTQFEQPSERVVTAPTSVYLSFIAPARTTWSLAVAKDFLSNSDTSADSPVLVGFSVETVPW